MQNFEKLKPVALLLVRWALGIIYIYHGYPKLFGQTEAYLLAFPRMGFPSYFAYIAGVFEFFGGCLLIIGLFTRVAGLLLTIEMGVAIWKVHLVKGVLAVNVYEFPLALGVAAFTLMALGAGAVSLDRAIFKNKA